jgi:hypothetical protein
MFPLLLEANKLQVVNVISFLELADTNSFRDIPIFNIVMVQSNALFSALQHQDY